ncbi:MAG: hypothetical protein WBP72_02875, partial [Rhodocyclaceae bacterium]
MRTWGGAGPLLAFRGFVFAAFLALAHAGWAGALVTDARGPVETVGSGKPVLLSELLPGAVLRLGAGARLTFLDMANGDEYTLKGPGKYQLAPQGLVVLEGGQAVKRTLPVSGAAAAQLRVSEGAQATLVLRGVGDGLRLLSPVDTAVIGDRPAFRWFAAEGASSYRFTLLDEAAAKVY